MRRLFTVAVSALPAIRHGSVLLFDRGYPGYKLVCSLRDNYSGYFVFRCPAKSTFPAVEEFVRSGRQEGYIQLHPSNNYLKRLSPRQRKKAKVIQLRIVRLLSPAGTVSVLLTNLLNKNGFPKEEIVELYLRRWAVEDRYRTGKVALEIEKFHIFSEILSSISAVRYYRAKSRRPTQPRVTKRPPNKWCSDRREKLGIS